MEVVAARLVVVVDQVSVCYESRGGLAMEARFLGSTD